MQVLSKIWKSQCTPFMFRDLAMCPRLPYCVTRAAALYWQLLPCWGKKSPSANWENAFISQRSKPNRNVLSLYAPIPLFMTVNATHSLLVKGVDSQSWLRKWLTLYIKWKCPLSSVEWSPLGVACGVRRGESKSDYLAQLSPRLLWPGVDSAKSKIYIFPETCHYYFVGDFEGGPFAELLIAVINTTPWGGQVSTILWCPPYHGVHPSMVSTQPSSSNFDKQPGGRNAHRRCQTTCFLLSFL